MRESKITRKTKETDVTVRINLDGTGVYDIKTGIGFFDHMLTALSKHSGIDLVVLTAGDLEVDAHHTVEDTGIVIGQALSEALGTAAITRYGSAFIPMDEALGFCSLDICNRPYLVFDAEFTSEKCGDFDTSLTEEFFRAVSVHGGITLHMKKMYGKNDHHAIEAMFKAFAYALKTAVKPSVSLLSTKGTL
ncbi:MAG: imidazoleglycerol-phosphate dehydratase HisB [Ruminococcus sp.]|jgi:imidazoleglycerol-phosphate dehydratase|nr:imidazoleglycerol-phosphate dehydratase HisB [Ruminococcus sp.]